MRSLNMEDTLQFVNCTLEHHGAAILDILNDATTGQRSKITVCARRIAWLAGSK